MQLNLESSGLQAKRDVHFAQQPKLEPIEPLESTRQLRANERTGSKDSMGKGPQPKNSPGVKASCKAKSHAAVQGAALPTEGLEDTGRDSAGASCSRGLIHSKLVTEPVPGTSEDGSSSKATRRACNWLITESRVAAKEGRWLMHDIGEIASANPVGVVRPPHQ